MVLATLELIGAFDTNDVWNLTAALCHNGQIGEQSHVVLADGGAVVSVELPRGDALDHRWDNDGVTRSYANLPPVRVTILGSDPESVECRCGAHSSFILFTTAIHRESPLRCGNCFRPVPL